MKKSTALIVLLILGTGSAFAQQTSYDVIPGNGNGLRLWQSDAFKIHMGSGIEYQYGPVTDYSIKMNMSNDVPRGWTWGVFGQVPIAAINTLGNMQIAGKFTTGGDIQISNATLPMGFITEVGGTTPLLNMSLNFREPNKNTAYRGADFRIDSRDNSQLFQWYKRDAGSTSETMLMCLLQSGNVGIGTTAPYARLHVAGSGGGNVDMLINGRITSGDAANAGGMYVNGAQSMFMGQSSASSLGFYNNGLWRLTVTNTGYVGIGTQSPDQMLSVNGTIHSKEVKVDLSVPGPDYVFEENYKLPSLEEIKTYIDQHKHLPEVPSAKEMEANGINVGEMNIILLKKVEEMTLMLINANNEIKKLNHKVDALSADRK